MTGEFKFVVRQLGRGCSPDISVSTQAPSSCGVRVCIEKEMSYFMQTVADQMHVLSHYKVELKTPNPYQARAVNRKKAFGPEKCFFSA